MICASLNLLFFTSVSFDDGTLTQIEGSGRQQKQVRRRIEWKPSLSAAANCTAPQWHRPA